MSDKTLFIFHVLCYMYNFGSSYTIRRFWFSKKTCMCYHCLFMLYTVRNLYLHHRVGFQLTCWIKNIRFWITESVIIDHISSLWLPCILPSFYFLFLSRTEEILRNVNMYDPQCNKHKHLDYLSSYGAFGGVFWFFSFLPSVSFGNSFKKKRKVKWTCHLVNFGGKKKKVNKNDPMVPL